MSHLCLDGDNLIENAPRLDLFFYMKSQVSHASTVIVARRELDLLNLPRQLLLVKNSSVLEMTAMVEKSFYFLVGFGAVFLSKFSSWFMF